MSRVTLPPQLRLLVSVLLIGSSLSCGETSPTDTADPPSLTLSSSAAAFAALAGAPAAVETIAVTNSGDGTLSGLSASVAYGTGQPTGWLVATLGTTTAPATLTLSASTTSTTPGSFDAVVTVASSGAGGSRTLHVTLVLAEGSAPTIVITSPARAAMLQQGDFPDSDVQVTGAACHDEVPIAELVVNGVDVPVSGTRLCESFDVMQSSAWGSNTIAVHAANAYGRSADHVQSYLRSPSYRSAAEPWAPLTSGVFVHLNQAVLDDDNADLDDLASIVAAVLAPEDIFALMPHILTTTDVIQTNEWWNPCTDELWATKQSLAWSTPVVSLVPTANGIDLRIELNQPSIAIAVSYTGCLGNTTTVPGALRADKWILTANLRGAVQATGLNVTGTSISSIQNPWLDLDESPFISAVVTLLDWLGHNVAALAGDAFEDLADSEIGPLLEGFLESLTIDQAADVNGRALTIHGRPDLVQHGAGYLGLGLSTGVALSSAPTASTPAFGAILAEEQGAPPAFSTSAYGLGAAIKLDLINQLFWSAWQAGAFDASDIAPLIGGAAAGLGGSITALLPPVILPGTGTHTFDIGWGDLAVSALVDRSLFGLPGGTAGAAAAIQAFGSARVGITLGYDDVEDRIVVAGITPAVQVHVATATELLDGSALASALGDAIESILTELIPSVIAAIPPPTLDFAATTGTSAPLGLTNATVARNGGYLTLTGDVVVR